MWLLDRFLRRAIRTGPLQITDADGKVHLYGSGKGDPLRLRFTDRRTAGHIARNPSLGAGEAYMRGWMVVEPPHDIRDLVLMIGAEAKAAKTHMDAPGRLSRMIDRAAWYFDQFNDRRRSSRNVRHHYDLTRQFYEMFLDEDRQYTMAYFSGPQVGLEQAQLEKKALIAAKLRLPPDARGMRVLDIGCGWGAAAGAGWGCFSTAITVARCWAFRWPPIRSPLRRNAHRPQAWPTGCSSASSITAI